MAYAPSNIRARSQVAICIFIGAVSTVAVAWATTLVGPRGWAWFSIPRPEPLALPQACEAIIQARSVREIEGFSRYLSGPDNEHLIAGVSAEVGSRDVIIGSSRSWQEGAYDLTDWRETNTASPDRWGTDLIAALAAATDDVYHLTVSWHAARHGWPWLSLWGESAYRHMAHAAQDIVERTETVGQLIVPCGRDPQSGRWNAERGLPYLPLMNGFMADTLVFGAAAWLLLFGAPRLVLRAFRRRLGRCVHCAYDLRATGDRCPECGRSVAQ